MLLGLGQVTLEEVNRLEKAAMQLGKGSFKYAWCSDRTRNERERGLSTHASPHAPASLHSGAVL
jgi:translation elongation factor EF-1alpha